MHCQDWRRLPCQKNNVDIHHKRPAAPTTTESMDVSVCVVLKSISPPVCALWNKSSQHFISRGLRLYYSIGPPYLGRAAWLLTHALSPHFQWGSSCHSVIPPPQPLSKSITVSHIHDGPARIVADAFFKSIHLAFEYDQGISVFSSFKIENLKKNCVCIVCNPHMLQCLT